MISGPTTLLFSTYRDFLEVQMPKVASNHYLLANMRNVVNRLGGNTTVSQLQNALANGRGPEVFVFMGKTLIVNGEEARSSFSRDSGKIEHSRGTVEEFEAG